MCSQFLGLHFHEVLPPLFSERSAHSQPQQLQLQQEEGKDDVLCILRSSMGDHPSIPARAQDQGSQAWKPHKRGNASPGKQCCPWCFGSSAYISAVPGRWHSNHSQTLSRHYTDSPLIGEAVLLNTSLFHLHHKAGKE